MRVNVAKVRRRYAQGLQRHGVDVTLHWKQKSGGTVDPTTGFTPNQIEVDQQATVRAYVDYVKPGDRRLEFHQAFEINDVVLDFQDSVVLDGRQELYFEIEGKSYVPKHLGDKSPESWGAVIDGHRIGRTVLARLRT